MIQCFWSWTNLLFTDITDDSDNDDVVLIKEEIEVDSEDVIFLSEDKPEPKKVPPPQQDDDDLDLTDKSTGICHF